MLLMQEKTNMKTNPWKWVPTLYFAQGLPYVAVMAIAVIMYKRLGLSNTDIALYTSWLYLPWVIKPLWSPFVDLLKTKRFWVVSMQALVAAGFAGVAFFIPAEFFVQSTLAFFWLLAFSSATHDIAADGFYMLALDSGQQSFFVGIRNTFYRFATIFGQGLIVMFAGLLEEGVIFGSVKGNIPLAWSIAFLLMSGLFIALALYHKYVLPHPASDGENAGMSARKLLNGFIMTFVSFFRKKNIGTMLFFLLAYRLGESQLVKIAYPFLLDGPESGGLGLSVAAVGAVSGTIGVIALLVGGIIGGIAVSRGGLRKWMLPMALAINLPDLLYVMLAYLQTGNILVVTLSVAVEQFGYGFGFTAYTLYLIYAAEGPHKTAHYAIGTGFMAMGMMLPGMIAGWLQEMMGYTMFFVWVCIATVPGIAAALMARRTVDPCFGRS